MAKADNTNQVSSRESMLARARERFPDRQFADIGAAPQEGDADLDDTINEMLEEYSTRQATYDENNARLSELLMSDPSAAEFLQKWVETGDPRSALVETFGEDLGMSEEASANFKGQLDDWRKRRDESAAADATAESNYREKSIPALEEWGNAKGLSMEQKAEVMLKLIDIAVRGVFDGLYTAEDFDLAWNALNHDNDVAEARAAGEVAGRNEKIAAARRDRNTAGAMPPAPVGGQGGRTMERQPKGQRDIWDNLSA